MPHSDFQSFLRDLFKLLGIPFLLVVGLVWWWHPWSRDTYVASGPDGAFGVAASTWDWEGADSACVANPHSISFSPDRRQMLLAVRVPWTDSAGAQHRVSIYDVQRHDQSSIRGLIRGEDRLTEDGVPVVWDLVLTGADSYAWHRTDWAFGARTKGVVRCPPTSDSLVPPP